MLKGLQISFLLLLAIAIVAFSAWRYFCGGAWWLAAIAALIGYAALLSWFFLGSREAWHGKAIRIVFDVALSSPLRATVSLVLLLGVSVLLCTLAYRARPADTSYYEVRVYNQVDLPANYQVGANVILHTRTDGLTHRETVGDDGAAVFRSVPAPTTLAYQLEVSSANPPFVTGGSHKIDQLPDQLAIDTTAISPEQRQPLSPLVTQPAIESLPRPANYLLNVDERGDQTRASKSTAAVPPRGAMSGGYRTHDRCPMAPRGCGRRSRRPQGVGSSGVKCIPRLTQCRRARGSDPAGW